MVNQEQVLEILHAIGEKITEEKLFLTELDNVIGDGDHGINLAAASPRSRRSAR